MLHLLECFALEHIAQRHSGDLGIGHFNADDVAPRHRRFDTNRLGRQSQSQVIGQRGDLADFHFGDFAATLHKPRFHTELRNGRAAIHFDDFAFHAKGLQGFFDEARILTQIIFAQRGVFTAFKYIFDLGQFPRLLQADDVRIQRAGR